MQKAKTMPLIEQRTENLKELNQVRPKKHQDVN